MNNNLQTEAALLAKGKGVFSKSGYITVGTTECVPRMLGVASSWSTSSCLSSRLTRCRTGTPTSTKRRMFCETATRASR